MTELGHLLAPLNAVLFTFGNDQVTVAELLGFVTGAASVWLTVLARVSNFPVGIANSAFFLVLFVSARLFGAAHDIAPFWDALTTALSLAAQFLLNCKRIENWGFWIAADVVYIPLYTVKRLDLTAIVYVLFLAMCFAGVAAWRRALRAGRQAAARAAATAMEGAA